MNLLEALWLVAAVVAGVGALVATIRSTDEGLRREVILWATWTPVVALVLSLVGWMQSRSALDAVATAVVFSPFVYPLFRLSLWARTRRYTAAADWREEQERLKYRAKDFDGRSGKTAQQPVSARPAVRPAIDAGPLTLPASSSRLARVTVERRSRWVRAAEGVLVVSVITVFVVGILVSTFWDAAAIHAERSDTSDAVAAALALNGFSQPEVGRRWLPGECGLKARAYHWTAAEGYGGACVGRYDGAVDLKIEDDSRSEGRRFLTPPP